MRQIADASGNVTLAESYESYGKVLTSTGTASSIFGYSGEQIDGLPVGVSACADHRLHPAQCAHSVTTHAMTDDLEALNFQYTQLVKLQQLGNRIQKHSPPPAQQGEMF